MQTVLISEMKSREPYICTQKIRSVSNLLDITTVTFVCSSTSQAQARAQTQAQTRAHTRAQTRTETRAQARLRLWPVLSLSLSHLNIICLQPKH